MRKFEPIEIEFTPKAIDIFKATFIALFLRPARLLLILAFTTIYSNLILKITSNYLLLTILLKILLGFISLIILYFIGVIISLIFKHKHLLQHIKSTFEEDGLRTQRNNVESFYKYTGMEKFKVSGDKLFIFFKNPKHVGWVPLVDNSDELTALLEKKINGK